MLSMSSFTHIVYGSRGDYGLIYYAKKEVMFVGSLLEMVDGVTFRNGEFQSLVSLEWHAIPSLPKCDSNRRVALLRETIISISDFCAIRSLFSNSVTYFDYIE